MTFDNLPEDEISRNYSCRLKPSQLEAANLSIHCKRVWCCAMQQSKNILMDKEMKKFNLIQLRRFLEIVWTHYQDTLSKLTFQP
jgi:hypothetical protein